MTPEINIETRVPSFTDFKKRLYHWYQ
jgi:hypothetical protein